MQTSRSGERQTIFFPSLQFGVSRQLICDFNGITFIQTKLINGVSNIRHSGTACRECFGANLLDQ